MKIHYVLKGLNENPETRMRKKGGLFHMLTPQEYILIRNRNRSQVPFRLRHNSEPRAFPPALPIHKQQARNRSFCMFLVGVLRNNLSAQFPHATHRYILGQFESVSCVGSQRAPIVPDGPFIVQRAMAAATDDQRLAVRYQERGRKETNAMLCPFVTRCRLLQRILS